MRATWAGCLAATIGVLIIPGRARGEGSGAATPPAPAPATAAAAPKPAGSPTSEAEAVLAETNDRLGRLAKPGDKEATSTSKALREVLEERVRLVKDWLDAARAHHEARNPDPSPERQSADWKADLERVKTLLESSDKRGSAALPAAFRKPTDQLADAARDALRTEMKEAIEEARTDLREWKSRLEALRSAAAARSTNPVGALQAERDKIQRRVATLGSRRAERQAALAAADDPDEHLLASERLANFEWEARVEAERLQAQECRMALEARRADLAGLHQQVCEAHVQLATKALEQMQERYRALTLVRERDLKKTAADQQRRAAEADDPLEQFKARWEGQLAELEAQAIKYENELASSGSPSLEEQTSLADRAVGDLANIRKLLDDGAVSRLDALRLNNDFRRIGPERARIEREELAKSAQQSTHYENVLTGVEIEMIHDRRADQFEQKSLLERIPGWRGDEAKALFDRLDRRHEQLLERNRAALEKLAERAERTHDEIARRLRALDDQYGFIRTHIFWVRDQEPLGTATLARARRDVFVVGKALVQLAGEAGDGALWRPVSAEFAGGVLAFAALTWPLVRLRRWLLRKSGQARRPASGVIAWRGGLVGVGYSAILPTYLALLAYTARQAPWPRSWAVPMAAGLAMLVPAGFLGGLVRWMLRPGGWAEETMGVPAAVTRQLRRAVFALMLAAVPLLLPAWLLDRGLIAPGGRPIAAAAFGRLLGLAFELIVWAAVFRLVRRGSPLVKWLLQFPERLGWLERHARGFCWSVLAAIVGVIVLDASGFSYTARRLAVGAGQGLVLLGACWVLYKSIVVAIDHHAWRWIRIRHASPPAGDPAGDATVPDDLAIRLRRLAAYVVPIVGLVLAAWLWDVDWALFRFLGDQPLWQADGGVVEVRDFAKFVAILALTVAAWRHMSTFFAVAVFPRMRDDPGVRFAVVTLCRYAVLAVGLLAGLSTIHLGLEKIGMVLAALGVGLGFGLQEIVSNFICGIILLLERPIRVDDVVTVSDMTGKVDRINIRATTIINGDNQSIIVPNRAFITSDLVNWTLKDKVIRITIRVKAAHGTDPDRVSELLLALAREDADVLRNPLPSSFMEDFSDSALNFALHAHVPDPSLASKVRHRLFVRIQRRFAEEGIEIPLPTQELRVQTSGDASGRTAIGPVDYHRLDPAAYVPPAPKLTTPAPAVPPAVEDCHRGVDE